MIVLYRQHERDSSSVEMTRKAQSTYTCDPPDHTSSCKFTYILTWLENNPSTPPVKKYHTYLCKAYVSSKSKYKGLLKQSLLLDAPHMGIPRHHTLNQL